MIAIFFYYYCKVAILCFVKTQKDLEKEPKELVAKCYNRTEIRDWRINRLNEELDKCLLETFRSQFATTMNINYAVNVSVTFNILSDH